MAGPISFGYQVLGFGGGKAPAAATGDLITVSIYNGNEIQCCTGGFSSTGVLVDDANGAAVSPSVNDVISIESANGTLECAVVTAINQGGSTSNLSYGIQTYSDCAECYSLEGFCFGEGEFCLLPHMLVKLIDGSLVKVSDLNVGDLINSPYGFTEITELITDHPRDGYYIIENELYISDDHPILVDNKMIEAKNYPGNKKYVNLSTDTVYVGTASESYYVYCENNVYTVSGQYKDAS